MDIHNLQDKTFFELILCEGLTTAANIYQQKYYILQYALSPKSAWRNPPIFFVFLICVGYYLTAAKGFIKKYEHGKHVHVIFSKRLDHSIFCQQITALYSRLPENDPQKLYQVSVEEFR